jgi:23S rRNA-/tRNA-specific pseudouridylate synthase
MFKLCTSLNLTVFSVLHRLDKVTSGVLLIAKTMEAAKKYAVLLANHSFRNHDDDDDDNDDVNVNITNDKKTKKKWVKKEYVCRVEGKFPDGQVRVQMPVTYICRKLGLNMCVRPGHTLGKPSETIFERLAYNGTDSLVKCMI